MYIEFITKYCILYMQAQKKIVKCKVIASRILKGFLILVHISFKNRIKSCNIVYLSFGEGY